MSQPNDLSSKIPMFYNPLFYTCIPIEFLRFSYSYIFWFLWSKGSLNLGNETSTSRAAIANNTKSPRPWCLLRWKEGQKSTRTRMAVQNTAPTHLGINHLIKLRTRNKQPAEIDARLKCRPLFVSSAMATRTLLFPPFWWYNDTTQPLASIKYALGL